MNKVLNDFTSFNEKNGIKDENELQNSAVKFILNNPNVNSYLYGFKSYEAMQRIVPLSVQKLTSEDNTLLSAYKENFGSLYCRHACGICEESCPEKVPVNTLLRYRHYFTGNADEAYALRKYNSFAGPKADKCLSCSGFCEKACPYGVKAKSLLIDAHLNLNLLT